MAAVRLGRLALFGFLTVTAAASSAQTGTQPISSRLFSGLAWRCIGPIGSGPVASVAGVAGQAGVYEIITPSGGAWKTIDGGDTWEPIDRSTMAPASDPHRWIDPANPRRIVRTESGGIGVSLDGGEHWVSSHHLAIAEVARLTPESPPVDRAAAPRVVAGAAVNASIADPVRAGLIFAGTNDAVYVSFDSGVSWTSLQLNLPPVRINDLGIRGNNLVAATQGRSVWMLEDISPLRQLGPADAPAAARLFKPVDATLEELPDSGVYLDYYLGAPPHAAITLDVTDAGGRTVHAATSAPSDPFDLWLAATRPLPATAGHHRVAWNLRMDPPPAQQHRYARLAPVLFQDMPADPDGPIVLPGSYRVRLTVDGRVYSQPIVVRDNPHNLPSPAALAVRQRRFDFAMKMYDAMRIAHREFVALARARDQLRPSLLSPDATLAQFASTLDARLAEIDGSDWTGLVIPDADDEAGEVDEKEGKHPDFVPPKPVSVSKDYDDPTSILGRRFANIDHPPAFATTSVALGEMLTKAAAQAAAPDALAVADYQRTCSQLAGVLATWRSINTVDMPRMNAELTGRRLPLLPVAARVPVVACGAKLP